MLNELARIYEIACDHRADLNIMAKMNGLIL